MIPVAGIETEKGKCILINGSLLARLLFESVRFGERASRSYVYCPSCSSVVTVNMGDGIGFSTNSPDINEHVSACDEVKLHVKCCKCTATWPYYIYK